MWISIVWGIQEKSALLLLLSIIYPYMKSMISTLNKLVSLSMSRLISGPKEGPKKTWPRLWPQWRTSLETLPKTSASTTPANSHQLTAHFFFSPRAAVVLPPTPQTQQEVMASSSFIVGSSLPWWRIATFWKQQLYFQTQPGPVLHSEGFEVLFLLVKENFYNKHSHSSQTSDQYHLGKQFPHWCT